MKQTAKNVLTRSGLLRAAAKLQPSGAAILMYHSVLKEPASQSKTLGGIIHSNEVFSRQMELLAKEFQPLSIDDLLKKLQNEERVPARSVVVTFDDGYKDNLENAVPILNRTGVPAIFYITVDCVNENQPPWPSRVRYALMTTQAQSWKSPDGTIWPLKNQADRDAAFVSACENCCRLAGMVQNLFVISVETDLNMRLPADASNLMMTWDEIKKVQLSGHAVGSHTLSHPNVAQISRDDVRTELGDSRSTLEKYLGCSIKHFSYPCPALVPHWNQETLEECRNAGYETAVVTDGGLARKREDLLRLKRIRPSKTLEGLRWNLEWAFAGRPM